MRVRERELQLGGLCLAAREWGDAGARPVLALHGWLDNAATFDRLAPLLEGLNLVALDMPGHGRSDAWPASAPYHFIDTVGVVLEAADALGWQQFALVGHSMGAGIASLVPAVAADRVRRLALLEGLGPLTTEAEAAPERLASALAAERRLGRLTPRLFEDLDAAVSARSKGTDVDLSSARLLVERGTAVSDDGLRFTHDPRLKIPSRLRLTEAQVLAFLAAIRCPVWAMRATEGWPVPEDQVAARLAVIPRVESVEVPGDHHVHLTHADRVAPRLQAFLRNDEASTIED